MPYLNLIVNFIWFSVWLTLLFVWKIKSILNWILNPVTKFGRGSIFAILNFVFHPKGECNKHTRTITWILKKAHSSKVWKNQHIGHQLWSFVPEINKTEKEKIGVFTVYPAWITEDMQVDTRGWMPGTS